MAVGQLAAWARLAPPGLMISQKSVWLAWPPPLLRTAVRMLSGTLSRFCEELLDGSCSAGRGGPRGRR